MMIQDLFLSLGKWGCLAICYAISALDGSTDEKAIFAKLLEAKSKGAFDDECYVSNPKAFGLKNVSKVSNLENCKGQYAAVKFSYNGNNHFVLYKKVSNGFYEPYFNSLDYSNCVKFGRIMDVRDITI